jgi:hypothetical protein
MAAAQQAEAVPFETIADFGLDESVPAEEAAFVQISEAMNLAQTTTQIGLTLFTRYVEDQEMSDDLRLAMENWQTMARLTAMMYSISMRNAESFIQGRIVANCNGAFDSCLPAYEDSIELAETNIAILGSMQGLDLLQVAIEQVLN